LRIFRFIIEPKWRYGGDTRFGLVRRGISAQLPLLKKKKKEASSQLLFIISYIVLEIYRGFAVLFACEGKYRVKIY
jgi:hypothetical protein